MASPICGILSLLFLHSLHILFFNTVGVNELSLRLPSAIASFLCCISILLFGINALKNTWIGVFSAMVLVASSGYFHLHIARGAEYDALLTFFHLLSLLFFFLSFENKSHKYIMLSVLCITMAVLTKGVAGLFFTPFIVLYIAFHNKQFSYLLSPKIIIIIALAVLVVGAYYLMREYENSGYLQAVYQNEIVRGSTQIENHKEPVYYYVQLLAGEAYGYWFLLSFGGVFFAILRKHKFMPFIAWCLLGFLALISLAQTKLYWYMAPLFPLLALLAGFSLYNLFVFFMANGRKWIVYGSTLLLFSIPYFSIIEKINSYRVSYAYYHQNVVGFFLKEVIMKDKSIDVSNVFLFDSEPNFHHLFYAKLMKTRGFQPVTKNSDRIKAYDKIVVSKDQINKHISPYFNFRIIIQHKDGFIIQLLNHK